MRGAELTSWLIIHVSVTSIWMMSTARSWVWRTHKDGLICVSFDMLLQVLRTFERLSTEVAFMWFQGDVNSDVGSDVVTFDGRSMTVAPLTGQVEVIRALSTHMTLTDVFLYASISAKARLGPRGRSTHV